MSHIKSCRKASQWHSAGDALNHIRFCKCIQARHCPHNAQRWAWLLRRFINHRGCCTQPGCHNRTALLMACFILGPSHFTETGAEEWHFFTYGPMLVVACSQLHMAQGLPHTAWLAQRHTAANTLGQHLSAAKAALGTVDSLGDSCSYCLHHNPVIWLCTDMAQVLPALADGRSDGLEHIARLAHRHGAGLCSSCV